MRIIEKKAYRFKEKLSKQLDIQNFSGSSTVFLQKLNILFRKLLYRKLSKACQKVLKASQEASLFFFFFNYSQSFGADAKTSPKVPVLSVIFEKLFRKISVAVFTFLK